MALRAEGMRYLWVNIFNIALPQLSRQKQNRKKKKMVKQETTNFAYTGICWISLKIYIDFPKQHIPAVSRGLQILSENL